MMNKRIYILLLLLSVFSCKQEEQPGGGGDPAGTVWTNLVMAMPSGAAGCQFTPNSSSVANGYYSEKVELKADGDTAVFSFKADIVPPYSAVYPSPVYSSMEDITIPARQKFVEGTVDENSVIMLGYSASGRSLQLKHAMAFLKLTIKPGTYGTDNLYEIKINGSNGEQLSGDFRPDFRSNTLSPLGKASSIIIRDTGDGIPLGVPIMVAIPPRSSIKLNFTLTDVKGVSNSIFHDTALRLTAGSVTELTLDYEPEPGSTRINLTPFAKLNASESVIADHAGLESRSYLVQMKSFSAEFNSDPKLPKPQTYSRVKSLPDGKYMLLWQRGSETRSDNNGQDTFYAIGDDITGFEYKGYLFQNKTLSGCRGGQVARFYTCPELLVLKNGDLLAVNSFWAPKTYSAEVCKADHGLAIKRSKDNGRTWSAEKVIFKGQCWEPFLMELANGEIHCYFTEARPWISSSNSGTSLVLSKDGGETWEPTPGSTPYRVIRKLWYHEEKQMYKYTDQMPVGIDINGTGKMAFAMEDVDVQTSSSTKHSVAVVYSPGNPGWDNLDDNVAGPSTRIDSVGIGACAPYMIQFPSGETIVSYSIESGSWPYRYRIGDASAKNFGKEMTALTTGGNWTGTCLDGSHCMLIASPYSGAIHLYRFALNHDIKATRRTVQPDADNSEWANTDEALYFCQNASRDATLRCSADDDNIYFLLEVSNVMLSASEYMYVFVDDAKIKVGPGGLVSSSKTGITAVSAHSGSFYNTTDVDTGWLAEIVVPRSLVNVSDGKVSIGASYSDTATGLVYCSGL